MSNECMSLPPLACRQACPYNTLKGCRVKEFGGICPLTNVNAGAKMPLTNADRIRAMTDEELARFLVDISGDCTSLCECCAHARRCTDKCIGGVREWLRQPVKED